MKHKSKQRILGRTRPQRLSLLRGLSSDLLKHGSLVTTTAKAKELRTYFEPLVTKTRGGLSRATRANLAKFLRHPEDMDRLAEVAKAHMTRPGGYLRITRLPIKRQDDAQMSRIDILDGDVVE